MPGKPAAATAAPPTPLLKLVAMTCDDALRHACAKLAEEAREGSAEKTAKAVSALVRAAKDCADFTADLEPDGASPDVERLRARIARAHDARVERARAEGYARGLAAGRGEGALGGAEAAVAAGFGEPLGGAGPPRPAPA